MPVNIMTVHCFFFFECACFWFHDEKLGYVANFWVCARSNTYACTFLCDNWRSLQTDYMYVSIILVHLSLEQCETPWILWSNERGEVEWKIFCFERKNYVEAFLVHQLFYLHFAACSGAKSFSIFFLTGKGCYKSSPIPLKTWY